MTDDFQGKHDDARKTIDALCTEGQGLAVQRSNYGKLGDPVTAGIDDWILRVGQQPLDIQTRLLAQLHNRGSDQDRSLVPLREAVLVRIQAAHADAAREHAERLSKSADKLSWVGIGVGVVGVAIMALQLWLAFRTAAPQQPPLLAPTDPASAVSTPGSD